MELPNIIYDKMGTAAQIIFNRPEKLNVMDFPGDGGIYDSFMKALDMAEDDDELKVVVIKGAGRAFCAGHDLNRIYHVYEEKDAEPGKRRPSQRARLNIDRKWLWGHQRLLLFPKVTIAQVHGQCIGEGAQFAELCDFTIVSEDAHISHAEQRLGFSGSGMNLIPLYQMLGYKRARDILLTGRSFDGIEAESMGWATKAVPLDKLEEEVDKLVKQISLLPYDGIAIGKATNHFICDILGFGHGWVEGYLSHTLFTNLRFEEGEYNFVRERRSKGARAGFHKRDERYMEA